MLKDVDKFIKTSKQWQDEISQLRDIILTTKLEESLKWNLPCYSFNDKNIAIIQPFKKCLALMFFQGKLLKDAKDLLVDNGPNSQAARRLEFSSVQDIAKKATTITKYLKEAVALEVEGKKVEFRKNPQPTPSELKEAFAKNAKLKKAFASLTPGRQRAYLLFFSGAKQSTTRVSRIEKCTQRILDGKGLSD